MIATAVEVAGAVLVLAAYALAQSGRLPRDGAPYLLLNLVGSGVLALLAARERQWGFLLLNGAWAVVSLGSLARRRARGHGSGPEGERRAGGQGGSPSPPNPRSNGDG